jgi:hypothetical protein
MYFARLILMRSEVLRFEWFRLVLVDIIQWPYQKKEMYSLGVLILCISSFCVISQLSSIPSLEPLDFCSNPKRIITAGHNRVGQLGHPNQDSLPRNDDGAYFVPTPLKVESIIHYSLWLTQWCLGQVEGLPEPIVKVYVCC